MQKRSSIKNKNSRSKDENVLAKKMVDFIIEETEKDSQQLPEKNPAAVYLGRLGGLKGGKARAKKLSAQKKSEIASKAAKARWNNTSKDK
jgi:hypothetical protein